MTASNAYLLLAREVITDPADNMNSIIKIIEKFGANIDKADWERKKEVLSEGQTIAIPIPFSIASSWRFDKKLAKDTLITIKMNIFDPSDKDLGGPQQEHTLPAGIDKINLNFKSDALPVTDSGFYKLHAEVIAKDKVIAEAEIPFEVELIQA